MTSRDKAKLVRAALIKAHNMDFDEFQKFYGKGHDTAYVVGKWQGLNRDVSRWFCELDLAKAAKFMGAMSIQEEYVADGGYYCPVCGSDDPEAVGPVDIDGSVATQEVHCNACGANWNDVLKLTGVSDMVYDKLVVELKLGDTSYGKQVLDRKADTVVGDLISVDTKGAQNSDKLVIYHIRNTG